jgi:hypothetical protein
MEKRLLIFLFVIWAGVSQSVQAQHPIPSYSAPVMGRALFVTDTNLPDGKTTIKIRRICSISLGVPKEPAFVRVWVFSIDQVTILGPFYLGCNQTLEVPIDDREWGVLVESVEEVVLDVWIE